MSRIRGGHRGLRLLFMALVSFLFFGAGAAILWAATLPIPDFKSFEERKVIQSTKIYDRTGEVLLFDVHGSIRRTVIPFSEISRHVKNATVAIEDAEFYEHRGIKPTAIIRALITNILTGSRAGGSTITQQVVKNSLLTNEKLLSRKLKEAFLALRLEKTLSKDEIFDMYLNEIPYGGSLYGIQEASRAFFGTDARTLSLAQAAYLAALPKAPTYYSPYGQNKDKLDERQRIVLARMEELGFITNIERREALAEIVTFSPEDNLHIKAPHFTLWVRDYLVGRYGEDTVNHRGLKVLTTLDWELQQKAEEIVARYGEENEKKFNATNAGMVGIDPKTGQVLVMVGSRDYFDTKRDGNFNITLAHRQPGSAFKPFVYATAFEKGYTPDTVVFDVQTQFQTTCTTDNAPINPADDPATCYTPGNYDNVFRGPIKLREALAQSVNIPAIKTLYLAGLSDSLATARRMGITSLADQNRYGLTLVLGGGEVSPLEITSAYGVFANDGIRNPYTAILRVETENGERLEEFTPNPERVLDEGIARQINDILSDDDARSPAFGHNSFLNIPGKSVAAKTGTTNDYRDAWIVGYSPTFALGAWAGNNDNTPMEKKVAGFVVAPMWNEFMRAALSKLPQEAFKQVPRTLSATKPVLRGVWRGGQTYSVDRISGKLATAYTPPELTEERVVPAVHSILYWVNKKDPAGVAPANPADDPQFLLWETPVRKWAREQGISESGAETIPTESDSVHTADAAPKVSIQTPRSGGAHSVNERLSIATSIQSKNAISRADFFVDGIFIGSATKAPFDIAFRAFDYGFEPGQSYLTVAAYDSAHNRGETTISIVLQ